MAFWTTKHPATQKESMIATIVLEAIMMSGLIYAVTSPLDWLGRFTIVACIVMYVFGTVAVLVLPKAATGKCLQSGSSHRSSRRLHGDPGVHDPRDCKASA